MTQEEIELYNKLKKEVSKANSRLARLQSYTGRSVSWAGKKLEQVLDNEKIGAWTPSSRISINKGMNIEQLQRIEKAVNEFLDNKAMSTIRTIKKQKKESLEGFKETFDVTDEEAEAMYEAFEDDLLSWAYRKIDPSNFWGLQRDAIKTNMTEKTFIDNMYDLSQMEQDKDISEKFSDIYKKYVEKNK